MHNSLLVERDSAGGIQNTLNLIGRSERGMWTKSEVVSKGGGGR